MKITLTILGSLLALIVLCYMANNAYYPLVDDAGREYPITDKYDPHRPWVGKRYTVIKKMIEDASNNQ
jgi:hypothetical protein